jgi:hypothetical protein
LADLSHFTAQSQFSLPSSELHETANAGPALNSKALAKIIDFIIVLPPLKEPERASNA